MLTRIQKLLEIRADSMFLWGPRQTGKSTLLKQLFPDAPYYDLLKSEVYTLYKMKPSRLRDECMMMDEGELVSAEISDFDIDKAVNVGTLPHHYLASSPAKHIQDILVDDIYRILTYRYWQ